ncbi:MAG: hypothetical protein KDC92_08460 [Bacteroidetes bacterium]|nr:hypothetical protein [Bacteroidota bacterium]
MKRLLVITCILLSQTALWAQNEELVDRRWRVAVSPIRTSFTNAHVLFGPFAQVSRLVGNGQMLNFSLGSSQLIFDNSFSSYKLRDISLSAGYEFKIFELRRITGRIESAIGTGIHCSWTMSESGIYVSNQSDFFHFMKISPIVNFRISKRLGIYSSLDAGGVLLIGRNHGHNSIEAIGLFNPIASVGFKYHFGKEVKHVAKEPGGTSSDLPLKKWSIGISILRPSMIDYWKLFGPSINIGYRFKEKFMLIMEMGHSWASNYNFIDATTYFDDYTVDLGVRRRLWHEGRLHFDADVGIGFARHIRKTRSLYGTFIEPGHGVYLDFGLSFDYFIHKNWSLFSGMSCQAINMWYEVYGVPESGSAYRWAPLSSLGIKYHFGHFTSTEKD